MIQKYFILETMSNQISITTMKKALLLLLAPVIMQAQGLQITTVTPTLICPGDSLHITVKFIPGNSTQIKLMGPSSGMNWGYDSLYIATNWPVSYVGPDTLYTLHTKADASMGFGIYQLYTVAQTSVVHNIDAFCGTVAIPEHALQHVPALYFDLLGNPVAPQVGKLLIEQHGAVRRKVFMLE